MAKFYKHSNNGVHAVVTEEVMVKLRHYWEMQREATESGRPFAAPYPHPIFTFSDMPSLRGVVTGTTHDMRELLAGHEVEEYGIFVPFSNCGHASSLYEEEAECSGSSELRFVVTLREVMDAFGLKPTREPAAV